MASNLGEPTERTRLLAHTTEPTATRRDERLYLRPAVRRILASRPGDETVFTFNDIPSLAYYQQFGYRLVVLLLALFETKRPNHSGDVWRQWDKTCEKASLAKELEDQIMSLWSSLLEKREAAHLDAALYTAFYVAEGSSAVVRGIDLVLSPYAPGDLVSHPFLDLHVRHVWRHGPPAFVGSSAITDILLRRLDAFVSPRALHFIDNIFHICYILLLLNYLVTPHYGPPIAEDGRVWDATPILVIIYAFAGLIQSSNMRFFPYFAVVLAFGAYLPDAPVAGDPGFDLLLFAFILHILFLHLPSTPTPLLFFQPQSSLPLASLLRRGFNDAFLPVLGLFLPALVLASILVSISMRDVFIQLAPLFPPAKSSDEAPVETRTGFLTLYFTLTVLFIASLIMLVLNIGSTAPTSTGDSSRWDRYGIATGRDARRALIEAVAQYTPSGTSVYYFPPPLNLLVTLLIRVPTIVFRRLRLADALKFRSMGERILWRLFVAPIAAFITLVWRLVDLASAER